MPAIPSIKLPLLKHAANFVGSDVTSARVNGAIPVEIFSKFVIDSTLTVAYWFSPAQASTVTRVELLDKDGVVLTSSNVYVPVSDTILIKHIIPVKEGVAEDG